ncbi:MAG: DUF4349 domain-containing protein, partial [Saprospiraceae bacterium]|nr:DUF4349 domain-containing protein [Saprospiraceae bacterium]
MKQSIFCFAIAFVLFLASACQNASKDASVNYETTEAYAPPAAEAATDAVAGGDADFQTKELTSLQLTSEDEQPTQTAPPPAPPQPKQPQPTTPPTEKQPNQPIARQIIKTADYRIQVENVDKSSRRANDLATKHGGYVSDSELTNSSYETTNRITIRVPANRFDSLLNDLGTDAIYTAHKRIGSQDVTEEYVDITTRLKTKIEVRDRYVDILRTKAKTVKDVLAAEEQIRIIQEEIEAKEGRLRYLKDQVGMSTIQLELYQSIEYRPEPNAFHESFWTKLVGGLKNGWELLQGIVIFFINIWPLLILGSLLLW